MNVIEDPKRFGHHLNAFGFLRLLFASLVIVSHTTALVNGNSDDDLLSKIFRKITFGEIAVDGFFLISGFLISASYLNGKTVFGYLTKRIFRIYPAYIVASILCVSVAVSLGGGPSSGVLSRILHVIIHAPFLGRPASNYGAFAGSHYEGLNESMWTLSYEFRCYILIIILGSIGLLENIPVLATLAFICVCAAVVVPAASMEGVHAFAYLRADLWLGDPAKALRLTGMFLAGAAFRSAQHRIPLRRDLLVISAIGLALSLFSRISINIGISVFGSYLIFAAAAFGRGTLLETINNKNDISYGVYLYGWPVEKILIAAGFGSSLLFLGLITWATALILGIMSWFLVEKPIMRLVRAKRSPAVSVACPTPHL